MSKTFQVKRYVYVAIISASLSVLFMVTGTYLSSNTVSFLSLDTEILLSFLFVIIAFAAALVLVASIIGMLWNILKSGNKQ